MISEQVTSGWPSGLVGEADTLQKEVLHETGKAQNLACLSLQCRLEPQGGMMSGISFPNAENPSDVP